MGDHAGAGLQPTAGPWLESGHRQHVSNHDLVLSSRSNSLPLILYIGIFGSGHPEQKRLWRRYAMEKKCDSIGDAIGDSDNSLQGSRRWAKAALEGPTARRGGEPTETTHGWLLTPSSRRCKGRPASPRTMTHKSTREIRRRHRGTARRPHWTPAGPKPPRCADFGGAPGVGCILGKGARIGHAWTNAPDPSTSPPDHLQCPTQGGEVGPPAEKHTRDNPKATATTRTRARTHARTHAQTRTQARTHKHTDRH